MCYELDSYPRASSTAWAKASYFDQYVVRLGALHCRRNSFTSQTVQGGVIPAAGWKPVCKDCIFENLTSAFRYFCPVTR